MKEHHKTERGGKTELLKFIKNENGDLAEPMYFNLGQLSADYIKQNLAPYWFTRVAMSKKLTHLQNAIKTDVQNSLILTKIKEGSAGPYINEELQFCYPDDPPQSPFFGVALNSGFVALYPYDIVCFFEPNGELSWGRMS